MDRWLIGGVRSREGGVVSEGVRCVLVELGVDSFGASLIETGRLRNFLIRWAKSFLHPKYLREIEKCEASLSTFA